MDTDVTSDFVDAVDVRKLLGHRPLYICEPDTFQVVKQTSPDMFTVYGPDRIYWVNIIEKQNENRFEAQLSFKQTDPLSALCYWLPWRMDGIVRIRLKPSRKYGHGTAAFSPAHVQAQSSALNTSIVAGAASGPAIVRPEFDPSAGGTPRLFFTGMMDGCSTWIAGDPQNPVVYHINRASHPTNVTKKDAFKLESAQHKIKTAQMRTDFQGAQAAEAAKDQSKGVGVTPDKWKIHHYNAAAAQSWARQMRLQTGVSGPLKVLKQYTSTFGIHSSGAWVFYGQDIYEYRAVDALNNVIGPFQYTAAQPQKVFPR
jgi:hypothetical protein